MKPPPYVVRLPADKDGKRKSENWQYRRDVPPDIREAAGVSRWRHSLRSAVLRDVLGEAARLTHQYNEFVRIERERRKLSPEEAARIKEAGGEEAFLNRATERLRDADEAENDASYIHSYAELDGPVKRADPFSTAAREMLASTRAIAPDPDDARAEIDGLKAKSKRLREIVARDSPIIAKLSPATAAALPPSTDTATLRTVFDAWKKAKRPGNTNQYEVPLRSFEALHGRLLVKEITKAKVREFRDHLASGDLKETTASKHFRCLKTLLRFAEEDGYIDQSPAESVRWNWTKKKFSEEKIEGRRTFTVDEIRRLLAACDALPKKDHSKQDLAWFIRLALWTGARPEELSQLAPGDIADVDGVICLRIHDRGERKLKTASSVRDVPVHKALNDAGFLGFVESRKSQRLLFSTLKADGKGRLYTRMQRRWWRLMRNKVKVTDPRVVPYSARHTFKDALRLIDAPQYVADRLMGHTSPGRKIADGYGGAQVAVLDRWLQQVDILDERRSVLVVNDGSDGG